jgi:hypothetical protein
LTALDFRSARVIEASKSTSLRLLRLEDQRPQSTAQNPDRRCVRS